MKKITDLSLVAIFVFEALKWYIAGEFGRDIAQIIYVLCLAGLIFLLLCLRIKYRVNLRYAAGKNTDISTDWKITWQKFLFFSYLLLVAVSLIRVIDISPSFSLNTIMGRLLTLLLIVVFCWIIAKSYSQSEKSTRVWNYLTLGLATYVTINVMGWGLGLHNNYSENLQNLDVIRAGVIFSFWNKKILFPFSANTQVFAAESGLLATLAYVGILHGLDSHRNSVGYWYCLFLGAFGLVASNVRSALVAVLIVFLVSMSWKLLYKRYMPIIMVTIILVPVIFLVFSDSISGALSSVSFNVAQLARSGNVAELATLNNRIYFWQILFNKLSTFDPIHLIGYGAFGQVTSGLTRAYVGYWTNPDAITLQNAFLQHLVDIGYIGFVVFVAWIMIIMGRFSNTYYFKNGIWTPFFHQGTACLLYLCVSSTTDVSIYMTQGISYFCFLLISLLVFTSNERPRVATGRVSSE